MPPRYSGLVDSSSAWCTQTRGATAILFAIMILPLALLIAFAIDSSRQAKADQRAQFARDAAAFAGGLAMEEPGHSDAVIKQIALAAFRASPAASPGHAACTDGDVEIDRTTMSVRVRSDCEASSMIQDSFEQPGLAVSTSARAHATAKRIELALMLDVSGSMHGQKLDVLKIAAKQTARRLLALDSDGRVRVSFVTVASAVNAGRYGNMAQGRPGDDDSDKDGLDKVCVSERPGHAAHTDDRPGPGKWISDRAGRCPESSLMPLTADLAAFASAIDALEARGTTAGHLGVAWAWYLISPNWNGIWPTDSTPHAYAEPDTIKAVILVTDGRFNTRFVGNLGPSDQQAKKLCEAMRAEGVLVYAVAFRAPAEGQETLEHCAGSAQRYFETRTGPQLLNAYAVIASQLTALAMTE